MQVHDCKYCKYYLYHEVALRFARQKLGPGASASQVEASAKKGWEQASVAFLVRTMDVAHEMRPNATWGYWDLVPGRLSASALNDKGTVAALQPLWDSVGALFPSIYLPTHIWESGARSSWRASWRRRALWLTST